MAAKLMQFEVFSRRSRKTGVVTFRYRFRAVNGELWFSSNQGFSRRSHALKAIATIARALGQGQFEVQVI